VSAINLPLPHAPLIDRAGSMSREWYGFFRQLVQGLGGDTSTVTDVSSDDGVVGRLAAVESTVGDMTSSFLAIIGALAILTGTIPVANGGTGYSGAAWTAYTPTVTAGSGTFTTVLATGRFLRIGKIVLVEVDITITTNGTAATSVVFTLPDSTTTAARTVLHGKEFTAGKSVVASAVSGSGTLAITNYDATYPGASGNQIAVAGLYEAA
jgi:hypothetical protein